ncbi:DUF6177 family protein [Microbacterium sp. M3]|uniref:DUF6177 family protein n=1 Tax=Microbacterium arthrosphaerae TaxID=792652 RepID=A0ABU4GZT5_9MICO|nr:MULTISPECIES: DUF6177 family protein [Microbacterium]MDW4572597.1 DUF6177 family protein [Microbacterium arthrosphaerae]MDW7606452.1 DUF6177 family protein [Microbacterium sp. M3]
MPFELHPDQVTASVPPPHPLSSSKWNATVTSWSGAAAVQLTRGRRDWLRSVLRSGGRPLLITPPASRMSVGMLAALRASGGDWLLADERGVSRLNSDPVEVPAAPAHSTGEAWLGEVVEAVQVSVSVHHRADAGAEIGRAVEVVLGDGPGWGTSEPVTRVWDPRAITELARGRMPRPTRVFVASEAGAGAGLVRRVDTGVIEEWKFLLPGASGADAVGCLRTISKRQDILLGTAWACAAGGDATFGRELARGLRPLAVAVGPRALRRSRWNPDPQLAHVKWVGSRPRMRTLLVDVTASDQESLAALLRGVDPEMLARGLGATSDAQ